MMRSILFHWDIFVVYYSLQVWTQQKKCNLDKWKIFYFEDTSGNGSCLSRRRWIGRYLSYQNSLPALKFWLSLRFTQCKMISNCAINNHVLFNLMYDAVEIYGAQFFLFDKKLSGGPIALKRVSCWRMTRLRLIKTHRSV